MKREAGTPKAIDITGRTRAFAARVLKQVARSATSIGANVEEAQGAHPKADFANRMNVARREARETLYWMRWAVESEMVKHARMADLLRESGELGRILTSIVKRSRQ